MTLKELCAEDRTLSLLTLTTSQVTGLAALLVEKGVITVEEFEAATEQARAYFDANVRGGGR